VLKFLEGFPEAVFIRVAMEWVLSDEDVWSIKLEYRIIRAITFDPTVGSRSNFIGVLRGYFHWDSYSMASR